MTSPADFVAQEFAQAQNYASNAQGQLTSFLSKLSAAVQTVPLVDLNFPTVTAPSSSTAPNFSGVYTPAGGSNDATFATIASMIGLLNTNLTTRMNGGTGLKAAVEQAIWDRARARELQLAQAAIDDVTVQSEALGFELPPGVLNEGIRRETNEYYDKLSGLSRDIAIKQAELEQKNLLDAYERANQMIQEANEYENALSLMQQRRDQTAVEVYKANIEAFRGQVDGFRATVEQTVKYYEAQIKQIEGQMTFIQESAHINSEVARANLSAVLEAGKTGAQVYAQLTAAAYSIIHASAAISGSATDSVSYNYSNDTSSQPEAKASF